MALFFCPSVVVVAGWVVPSTHSGPSKPQVLSPSPCPSGGIVLCHWFFAWLFIPKPVNMIRLGFFTTPPLTFSAHSFLSYVFGECRSIGGRSLLTLSSGWRKHYGKLCKSLLAISRASLMLPVLATIWPVWVDGLIYSESKARGCLFRWRPQGNHGFWSIGYRFDLDESATIASMDSRPSFCASVPAQTTAVVKSGERELLYCFNDQVDCPFLAVVACSDKLSTVTIFWIKIIGLRSLDSLIDVYGIM